MILFINNIRLTLSPQFIVLPLLLLLIFMDGYSQKYDTPMDWANLEKYAAANKKLPAPAPNEKRVVFMGNSITEFWQYADTTYFKNKSYINRGISGQTSPQMLLRFRQDVIELKPYAVVILAGINDIAENTGPITMEAVFKNIQSMAELAKAKNINVILSSVLPANVIPWRTQIKPAEKVIKLNSLIEEYCKKNKIYYVDYYSTMVDSKKGLDKKYSDDGVHPNLTGYKVMETLVEEAIQKVLK